MQEVFEKVFQLMKISFPTEEYREYKEQKKLLKNPKYKLIAKKDDTDDELIAFMAIWDLKDFMFLEHFAVNPEKRGGGIGSNMMLEFIKSSEKPLILEVELPRDADSVRRIKFYEKLGFRINHQDYFQLPLRKNGKPIKMALMSYPNELSNKEFESFTKNIYQNIYQASYNLIKTRIL